MYRRLSLGSCGFAVPVLFAAVITFALSSPSARAQDEAAEDTPAEAAAEAAPGGAEAPALTLDSLKTALDEKSLDLDTVWTLVAAFLVMWMQAGFALVETGFTRAKNAVNIIMKNLLDFCFGSLAYWIIGFGLMFSIGNDYFGDSGMFLEETPLEIKQDDGSVKSTTNFDPISWTKVPLECKFFFQLVFAATAATIVSGAMAERTKFTSYMLYSIIISALIYPVSGHWIWGGGWLADLGMWDFAGSTVVHSLGGWMALAGALAIGPRLGKYTPDGKPKAIPGHNLPLAALGVFILWLGWFGFNPGSTMGALRNDISHIVCTTNTAGATGAITAMLVSKLIFKKWDASMSLNGVLAGLVAITAPCPWVSIGSSILIGGIAGVLVVLSVLFVERTLKIDDPVGAISVHGVCGAWGTLSLGLWSTGSGNAAPLPGLFTGGDATQLINQAKGVGAVFLWAMATGLVLFYGLKLTVGLRVTPDEEREGLDFGEHGNEAYHGFQLSTDV
ncbi:MAG TPA: ammonium transporter [Pirellulales bacterium]|nr:ammonium transporter [Pirellulales bacterium]